MYDGRRKRYDGRRKRYEVWCEMYDRICEVEGLLVGSSRAPPACGRLGCLLLGVPRTVSLGLIRCCAFGTFCIVVWGRFLGGVDYFAVGQRGFDFLYFFLFF